MKIVIDEKGVVGVLSFSTPLDQVNDFSKSDLIGVQKQMQPWHNDLHRRTRENRIPIRNDHIPIQGRVFDFDKTPKSIMEELSSDRM